MATSKIMQKLKKEHKKQVKKLKPGVRNITPKKTPVPVPTNKKTPTNLNRAVAKMKATQAKLNSNKNAKKVKMINKK